MHSGTSSLTDEALGGPPERIRAFFRDRGLDDARARDARGALIN